MVLRSDLDGAPMEHPNEKMHEIRNSEMKVNTADGVATTGSAQSCLTETVSIFSNPTKPAPSSFQHGHQPINSGNNITMVLSCN